MQEGLPVAPFRSVASRFGPRHPESAGPPAATITGAGTVLTAVFAVIAPAGSLPWWGNVVAPVVLLVATVLLLRASRQVVAVLCLLVPLAGVGLITGLDVATGDASAAAQVFFCLPVLYAASQLRTDAVALVTACALAGLVVVTFSAEPTLRATTDLVYVTFTLLTIAVLLGRAEVVRDRLTARLRAMAAIDPLTGLVTRRVLDDATQTAISSAASPTGTGLVLVDVDNFKRVNDTYGHPVGDDALAHIGRLLTSTAREEDVVARMGGDELAVLLPGSTYPEAIARAEQFVAAVQATPLRLADGSDLRLSISAGVAHAPNHASQVKTLYYSADAALYAAKRMGGAQVGLLPETRV